MEQVKWTDMPAEGASVESEGGLFDLPSRTKDAALRSVDDTHSCDRVAATAASTRCRNLGSCTMRIREAGQLVGVFLSPAKPTMNSIFRTRVYIFTYQQDVQIILTVIFMHTSFVGSNVIL